MVMNKKYVLKNPHGETVFCVIDGTQNADEEFKKVLNIESGHGFSVDVYEDEVRLVDYFHGDTRAKYEILAVTDTDTPLQYHFEKM